MADVLTRLDESGPGFHDGGAETVVVIGNFDGVHRGHQSVLKSAIAAADAMGLVPVVLTFDPHPSAVLGREPPPLLTTLPRRAELMARLGIRHVYAQPFDRAFAAWSPERFARTLLAEQLRARVVVVGENFRFGSGRSGDLATLVGFGRELGFEAREHAMESDARGVFSSTRVREAIKSGDLAEAAHVLGRRHAFTGRVGRGAQRGRTIGFPTANLENIAELLPPNGVYAVVVDWQKSGAPEGAMTALAPGVMNIGVRPTLEGPPTRSVEVHLFGTSRDLYGATLRVHLVDRLRDERKFAGFPELKQQIEKDARQAEERVAAIAPALETGTYG